MSLLSQVLSVKMEAPCFQIIFFLTFFLLLLPQVCQERKENGVLALPDPEGCPDPQVGSPRHIRGMNGGRTCSPQEIHDLLVVASGRPAIKECILARSSTCVTSSFLYFCSKNIWMCSLKHLLPCNIWGYEFQWHRALLFFLWTSYLVWPQSLYRWCHLLFILILFRIYLVDWNNVSSLKKPATLEYFTHRCCGKK